MTRDTDLEVRAQVVRAAHRTVPTWPLTSFIAVNPLGSQIDRPLEALVADSLTGGPAVTRSETEYRDSLDRGALTEAALRSSVAEIVPELVHVGPVPLRERDAAAIDIAILALLHLEPASPRPTVPAFSAVDDLTSQWLASLLVHDLPLHHHRDASAYERFRALAVHDLRLPRRARRRLRDLPRRAEAVVSAVLETERIPLGRAEPWIRDQLAALPGWSSHIAWRAAQRQDISLTDLLAIRLALHHALGIALPEPRAARPAPRHELGRDTRHLLRLLNLDAAHYGALLRVLAFLDPTTRLLIWQTAAERSYQDELLALLDTAVPTDAVPAAQVMFCIDTRSEGIRRQLEQDDRYQTFGFAGFFGVPLQFQPVGASGSRAHFPALLSAGIAVAETALDPDRARRYRRALLSEANAVAGVKGVGTAPAAAFAWAETAGLVSAVTATLRTIAPGRPGRLIAQLRARYLPPPDAQVDITQRLSLDQRLGAAEAILRMSGLTRFARLVVLAGHRTATANNLYRSALDCGACGGNGGAPNARAAAQILNDPDVRDGLALRDLRIPSDTWFIAAEHETATDTVTLLDAHLTPSTHLADAADLVAALRRAGDRLVRERAEQLPGASGRMSTGRIRARAHDWAEMYPELGLIGNAAMLIAPRSVSRGTDLGRRVFLHSYDARADLDGTALETIMTAPLIVAQWINAQYNLSALNPELHGAGHKSLHNPVGDIGVLTGSAGDLRSGLPWQSLAADGKLLHTPLRLAVFIQAPLDRITAIISRTDVLRDLTANNWIRLHGRASSTEPWRRYGTYGFLPAERNTS